MSSDLRTMLARLTDQQPPVDIDPDRQIADGRRRVRRRNLLGGLAGVVALGLFGGLAARLASQTADGPPQPAGEPTPSDPIEPPGVISYKDVSTARSQALGAQFAQVVAPEIARVPGAVLGDCERMNPDGTPAGWLWAGAGWRYPAGSATNMVDLTVEVANASWRVLPRVCEGMDAPPADRCSEVRTLADGSTAFIRDSTALGGHQYSVRIARPNGTQVVVFSSAQIPPGSTHDSVVGRDRVVEIAQQITVTP
jgi:hypothetical protein